MHTDLHKTKLVVLTDRLPRFQHLPSVHADMAEDSISEFYNLLKRKIMWLGLFSFSTSSKNYPKAGFTLLVCFNQDGAQSCWGDYVPTLEGQAGQMVVESEKAKRWR
jgi:hypothetical protein